MQPSGLASNALKCILPAVAATQRLRNSTKRVTLPDDTPHTRPAVWKQPLAIECTGFFLGRACYNLPACPEYSWVSIRLQKIAKGCEGNFGAIRSSLQSSTEGPNMSKHKRLAVCFLADGWFMQFMIATKPCRNLIHGKTSSQWGTFYLGTIKNCEPISFSVIDSLPLQIVCALTNNLRLGWQVISWHQLTSADIASSMAKSAHWHWSSRTSWMASPPKYASDVPSTALIPDASRPEQKAPSKHIAHRLTVIHLCNQVGWPQTTWNASSLQLRPLRGFATPQKGWHFLMIRPTPGQRCENSLLQ